MLCGGPIHPSFLHTDTKRLQDSHRWCQCGSPSHPAEVELLQGVPLTIRWQSKGERTRTQTDGAGLERSTKVTFREPPRRRLSFYSSKLRRFRSLLNTEMEDETDKQNKTKQKTHSSFWPGGSLAQGGVTSAAKATSSWELEDDWSDRCGGSSGGRSSSMITVSSCGMLTVGESW